MEFEELERVRTLFYHTTKTETNISFCLGSVNHPIAWYAESTCINIILSLQNQQEKGLPQTNHLVVDN